MSCKKCEDEPVGAYLRVEAANVYIEGCTQHLKQLIDTYKLGLKKPAKKVSTK